MRLENREVLGETNQRRRKERTEKGGGHHEARWIMGLCPGEVHPEDKLMEQKQPRALKQQVVKGHKV